MALNLPTISHKTSENQTDTETTEKSENQDLHDENEAESPMIQNQNIFSGQDRLPNQSQGGMITIHQATAERFMMAIEDCVGDIEEQKMLVESLIQSKQKELEGFQSETIAKFNDLIDVSRDLAEKIKATESYENYLQEQIKNADLSKQVSMLQIQLEKEKAQISSFIIKVDNFITMKVGELSDKVNELKSADEIIEMNIQKFKEELKSESLKLAQDADKQIEVASDTFIKGAQNQYESLKADCATMLKNYTEKCQQHLDTVKKQSLDFLKTCENENKKLIEKVPAVANSKFSKKDVIIYTLAGVSIASLLVQMLV